MVMNDVFQDIVDVSWHSCQTLILKIPSLRGTFNKAKFGFMPHGPRVNKRPTSQNLRWVVDHVVLFWNKVLIWI